jgi:hypothetical protein
MSADGVTIKIRPINVRNNECIIDRRNVKKKKIRPVKLKYIFIPSVIRRLTIEQGKMYPPTYLYTSLDRFYFYELLKLISGIETLRDISRWLGAEFNRIIVHVRGLPIFGRSLNRPKKKKKN